MWSGHIFYMQGGKNDNLKIKHETKCMAAYDAIIIRTLGALWFIAGKPCLLLLRKYKNYMDLCSSIKYCFARFMRIYIRVTAKITFDKKIRQVSDTYKNSRR